MSEIRYVTVPAAIDCVIQHPQTGLPVAIRREFPQFTEERTKDAKAFGGSLDGVLMALAIRQAFMGTEPGHVIGLSLAQWEALCGATRCPADGYNVALMVQVLPHARAILDAPSTRPEAKIEAVAAE